MFYQVTWKIEPGLNGLSCSEFRVLETQTPDNERGVAVECTSREEADVLVTELERVFGPQRYSNNATAFETVKAYVLEWAAKRAEKGK